MEKEKFDLESFPTSNSARKMLSYVSDGFYDESYVGKWIYQVMGLEYDRALEMVEDLPAQFFPETATWGLMYHETKWGLPVRENLPYDERRRLVFQKRDYRAPMTPYRMEEYLCAVTGFKVHVSDIHDPWNGYIPAHPNMFLVFFVGEGTLDVGAAINALKKIRQSHTVFAACEYVDAKFVSQVVFDARIHMSGAFYPRSNLPLRCLDGTTRLDGSYPLNGYLSGETLDFYPVSLRVGCGVGQAWLVSFWSRTAFCAAATQDVRGSTALLVRGTGECTTGTQARTQVAAGAGESGWASAAGHLRVEKAWGTLDGSRRLDGGRRLDAARYAVGL